MKKLLLIVLTGIFSISLMACATADSSLMKAPVTPDQSYHSTTGAPTDATKVASKIDTKSKKAESPAMAKVKAIMAAAKKDARKDSNPQTAPATVDRSQPAVASDSQETKGLQAQLSQLNQNTLLFQQTVNQRIEALTTQNTELTQKLQKLAQAFMLLNKEVSGLSSHSTGQAAAISAQLQGQTSAQHASVFQTIESKFGRNVNFVIYGAAILVFLFIALLMMRRGKSLKTAPAQPVANSTEDDTKDEYDFMSSAEAIPAKLDLARAYIKMDDFDSARTALEAILSEGNAIQQQEAKELLKNLPDAS